MTDQNTEPTTEQQQQEQPTTVSAVRDYYEKLLAEERAKTAKAQKEAADMAEFVKGMAAAKPPADDLESAIKKYLR